MTRRNSSQSIKKRDPNAMLEKIVVRPTEYERKLVWGIFGDDDEVATTVMESKRQAVAMGKELAKENKCELVVLS